MIKVKMSSLAVLALAAVALSPATMASAEEGGTLPQIEKPADGSIWSVMAGSSLRKTLDGWSRVAGWTVIWDSPHDYTLDASAVFTDDYMNAVGRLVDSLHQSHPELNATLYSGNRVLHVVADEITSQ